MQRHTLNYLFINTSVVGSPSVSALVAAEFNTTPTRLSTLAIAVPVSSVTKPRSASPPLTTTFVAPVTPTFCLSAVVPDCFPLTMGPNATLTCVGLSPSMTPKGRLLAATSRRLPVLSSFSTHLPMTSLSSLPNPPSARDRVRRVIVRLEQVSCLIWHVYSPYASSDVQYTSRVLP